MSLGELAVCEDFLDGQREYAIDLLSNLKSISQSHGTKSCSRPRKGRACPLCELCSSDGLMGATKTTLAAYDNVEKHLKTVRGALGKRVSADGTSASHVRSQAYSRAVAPGRETLFKNSLAKSVFVTIVTTGDTLRLQHAAWQARLQNELATSSLIGDVDKSTLEDILFPIDSGLRVVDPGTSPKVPAVDSGAVPETSSSGSSMFVIFGRCLSADCPCELNKNYTKLRGSSGLQVASEVPESLMNFNKTHTSVNPNIGQRTGRASDASDTKTQTDVQTRAHNPNNPEARSSSRLTPDTASYTQDASPTSSMERHVSIVNPRIFRLRAQVRQSDEARRMLMAWCHACLANLWLDLRQGYGTAPGPEAPLTNASTIKGTHGHPFALEGSHKTVGVGMLPCATGQSGEANDSCDDETTARGPRFDEQKDFEERWLTARQKRCRDLKRRQRGP